MLVDTFNSLSTDMRVPLTKDEAQGPTTSLVFLGLVIDTPRSANSHSTTNISKNIVNYHIQKKTITINSLQCIVGKLIIIAWDIPESRACKSFFLNR